MKVNVSRPFAQSYASGMSDDVTSVVADAFGVGMTVSEEGQVVILLVVTMGHTQVFVPLENEDIARLSHTLGVNMAEKELLQEAIRDMPTDAAKAYVENWIARDNSGLN